MSHMTEIYNLRYSNLEKARTVRKYFIVQMGFELDLMKGFQQDSEVYVYRHWITVGIVS